MTSMSADVGVFFNLNDAKKSNDVFISKGIFRIRVRIAFCSAKIPLKE